MLALHGLDALLYLTTDDNEERLLLAAVARRAMRIDEGRMRQQAIHVVNELGKAYRRRG